MDVGAAGCQPALVVALLLPWQQQKVEALTPARQYPGGALLQMHQARPEDIDL